MSEGILMRPQIPGEDAPVVVDVRDVSMVFNMASEQLNSLKEYFIKLVRHELFFKEFHALDHVSFQVRRGEAFGLVGTNGSGKSTMLKIIAGVLEASSGTCTVNGVIAPLIELGAGFDMELTARENIYLNGALLGYMPEFIEQNFDRIIVFAELQDFVDMPLKNYSSAWWRASPSPSPRSLRPTSSSSTRRSPWATSCSRRSASAASRSSSTATTVRCCS